VIDNKAQKRVLRSVVRSPAEPTQVLIKRRVSVDVVAWDDLGMS
jgi:hypothetical protein